MNQALIAQTPKQQAWLRSRIVAVVAEQLGVPEKEIKDTSRFVEDLGADSLDRLELVMSLEDELDIEVTDEEAERITSVEETLAFAHVKLTNQIHNTEYSKLG